MNLMAFESVIIVFGLAVLALWLFALVDILKSDFKDSTAKIIWVLVVLFLPFLGSILYFIIGRNNKVQ